MKRIRAKVTSGRGEALDEIDVEALPKGRGKALDRGYARGTSLARGHGLGAAPLRGRSREFSPEF